MKIQTYYRLVLAACRSLALFTILTLVPVLCGAQSLAPLFGNGAGAISQVASVQVAQDQFVTAVINSTGNLEVVGWYANLNTNQLVRKGTGYAGPVSAVAISSPFSLNVGLSGTFTTAAINANGNLDLIYWQMQPNGAISLLSEVHGDSASNVSVASVYNQNGNQQFVTGIRNALTGNLEVTLWYIDSTNSIRFSGSGFAGAVNRVSIACLQDLTSDVVTAVENSTGDLELIRWYYGRFGAAITRGSTTYTSTPASAVAVAPGVPTLNNPPKFVNAFFTTAIDPTTNLVNASGWNQDMGLQASTPAVVSGQVALAGLDTAAFLVASPSGSSGDYFLQVFDQYGSNSFDYVAGAYGAPATTYSISFVDTSSPSTTTLAVAYRNSAGNLQIQLWNYVR